MWHPQAGTVFVKKAVDKTVTEGGIHLPNAQVELTLEGEIMISPYSDHYKIGTKILFSKFAGSEVKVDGQSLFIIRTDDILATWREE